MSHRTVVFSLMNLLAAAEGRSPLGMLEADHRRLLVFVAGEVDAGRELCISNIIEHGAFGSPVTASKRLRDLEKSGWLMIYEDPNNHRRRIVTLTAKSQSAFGGLSDHVASGLSELFANSTQTASK